MRHGRIAPLILLSAALGLNGVPGAPGPPPVRHRPAAAAARPSYDQPDLAWEHYRAKRLGRGRRVDAARRYREAREQMARMPRHSTGRAATAGLPISRTVFGEAAAGEPVLDSWQYLGPGNIGGRTRALVIRPDRPARMWAAGVSGGIWKSTDRGRSWRPVGDQLANLAVNALALDPQDPNVLYAGTGEGYFREAVRGTGLPLRGGGIFKSEDGGESWEQLRRTRRRRFHWVNDLAVSLHDSARVYAATRSGVLRSLDGGESWERVLDPQVRGGCLDLVARTDTRGDYLLAACGTLAQGTVYRNRAAQKDGDWQQVLADPGMARASLAIAPSDQSVVYALAASNVPGPEGRYEQALHAVFRSDAGGAPGSWRATVRNSDPDKVNTLLLSNPITASLVECGFDIVNDFFAMGWYVNVIAVDPENPDRVWAGGVDLFRSDDGGRNWRPASYWWADPLNPNFAHADHHGLVFDPRNAGTLYSLNDGGIYRTRRARAPLSPRADALCRPGENDVTWEPLNRGYGVTQFYHGTPFPNGRRYLGGTQDNGTVLGSRSAGADGWIRIFGGDGGYSAVDPGDTDVLYVSFQGGQVRKSTDGGATFVPAVSGLSALGAGADDFRGVPDEYLFITPFVMDPNDPRRLWLGGRRLFRTDNGAAYWTIASAPLAGGGKVSALAVAPGDPDRVLAGTNEGDIFRSDLAGVSGGETEWEGIRPRAGWVSWLAFDPGDPDVAYATYARFGGEHVWKTDDGGLSWRPLDGGGSGELPDIPVHSLVVDPGEPRRLYLGTDLGVFASVDGGESWAVENTGFAAVVTESLAIAANPDGRPYLFAFTHGRGVWRVRLD